LGPTCVFVIDRCTVYTGYLKKKSYIGTLSKLWFIKFFVLSRVWFRQVSLYIWNIIPCLRMCGLFVWCVGTGRNVEAFQEFLMCFMLNTNKFYIPRQGICVMCLPAALNK
jgi:hypothetical protein